MVDINFQLPGTMNKMEDYDRVIEKVRAVEKSGINKIVIAPCYDKEVYEQSAKDIEAIVNKIGLKLKEEDIKVDVYPGHTMFADNKNVIAYLNGEVNTLNKGRYILIDLNGKVNNETLDVIYECTLRGLIPIIAHPEKYRDLHVDKKKIDELIEMECLFQLDLASLNGDFGRYIKRLAKKLLKKDLYDFIGTEESFKIAKIPRKKLDIFKENGMKLLKDERIENHIKQKKIKVGKIKYSDDYFKM
ncbi:CpsB/CapC family capsule biosynthesis tyrosine phosphatase [Clostridium sp.]|uniref:CpsB/CapC family capsule biosynthesis tyrosine phosphatase n=1 Tax=Clostridium sp. TaxID=1506 RepID=UPI003F3D83EF